jgi:hypothetical protein
VAVAVAGVGVGVGSTVSDMAAVTIYHNPN